MSPTSNSEGFIVLHRKIKESWIWRLPPGQFRVWIQLLLDARWALDEDKIQLPGETIMVGRGQLWTSERTLADRAGVSRKVVRSALKILLQDGSLGAQSRGRYGTLLTVTNYETYQLDPGCHDRTGAQEGTTQGPTTIKGIIRQKTLLRVQGRTRGVWSDGFKAVRKVYPQPRELKEAWQIWQREKLETLSGRIVNWVLAYENKRQAWLNAGKPDNEQAYYSLPYLKRFLRRRMWEEPISAQAKKIKPQPVEDEPNVLLEP